MLQYEQGYDPESAMVFLEAEYTLKPLHRQSTTLSNTFITDKQFYYYLGISCY